MTIFVVQVDDLSAYVPATKDSFQLLTQSISIVPNIRLFWYA
jgi:hypothetical protein